MRRRLVVVALATTLLVVIALMVPLGLLVRRQAMDRTRVATEREAQAAASLVALALTLDAGPEGVESAAGRLPEGVVVALDDGTTFGSADSGQGSLIDRARADRATIPAEVAGGWEIALPVISADTVVVIDSFASDEELSEGVLAAWAFLAALGLGLVTLAVFVADRLGRQMVEPMRDLAGAAHLLGEGDLETRVNTQAMSDVPEEIVEVGVAFNELSARLDELLVQEREAVADLSHRLRTPLTSLRLQAEKISDAGDREETLVQIRRLESAVDQMIEASRSRVAAEGTCHPDEVARERSAFWSVLAEEQSREFDVRLDAPGAGLSVSADEVGVVIDTLIGNVFSHTPPGTAFLLSTGEEDNRIWIEVADRGPGLPDLSLLERGASGKGSTGLGLDIVRRTAEMTGGRIELNDRPEGGAVVRVWFG